MAAPPRLDQGTQSCLRGGEPSDAVRIKRGAKVSPGDLDRRPPQRPRGELGSALAVQLGANVERLLASEKGGAENGSKRPRRQCRVDQCRDRRRGGLGLLRGDAAMADMLRGRLADNVEVVAPVDASELVRGDETAGFARESGQCRGRQLGRTDHRIGRHGPSGHAEQPSRLHGQRERRSAEGDAALPKQLPDRAARPAAEDLQRHALWCDDGQLDLRTRALSSCSGE